MPPKTLNRPDDSLYQKEPYDTPGLLTVYLKSKRWHEDFFTISLWLLLILTWHSLTWALQFPPPCLPHSTWLHPFMPLSISYFITVTPQISSSGSNPDSSKSQASLHHDSAFFSFNIYPGQKIYIFLMLTWFMWLSFNALFCSKTPFLLGLSIEKW